MITSQQKSILSDLKKKPIPESTLEYFSGRLIDRLHALVLDAYIQQSKEEGLTQVELAERLAQDPARINRLLGGAGNWTLKTVSNLLVAIGVDLDDPSFTPIAKLVADAEARCEKASPAPHPDDASSVVSHK
ncbi:MAG TPA: helix-turn-helix transcriptional regulator [Candidatus Binataceae bacterium]|jgi:hypothetical protein|nr:helix-turn-helix transcriptional regulator [Candidatus Binataceae bacterium]